MIEMKPEHHRALLALASRRGHKGISIVLGEAIESFLQGEVQREEGRETLLSLGGSLSKKDGNELRNAARELRKS
jgi:hypothetical protein